MKNKKKLINISILISIVLSVTVSYSIWQKRFSQDGSTVLVQIDNTDIETFLLNKEQVVYIYAESSIVTTTLQKAKTPTNVLTIKDGYAYVTQADCRDKICMNMGKICKIGQSIVCLPNRVVVTVIN